MGYKVEEILKRAGATGSSMKENYYKEDCGDTTTAHDSTLQCLNCKKGGSRFQEGCSFNRPPLFDGVDYYDWSSRMKIFLQAHDYKIWHIVKNGPITVPTKTYRKSINSVAPTNTTTQITIGGDANKQKEESSASSTKLGMSIEDFDDLSESDLKNLSLNAKAILFLYNSLCVEEFGKIKGCSSAKEIWDNLEMIHGGSNLVNQTKLRKLKMEYETFKMKEGEAIKDMHRRFYLIVNNLSALGNTLSKYDINSKILESLTNEYRDGACAIRTIKDIATLSINELMGSLMRQEIFLSRSKAPKKSKHSLAF